MNGKEGLMASITELYERLEFRKAALKEARDAYVALLNGRAESYTIGSRSLTRLDLDKLKDHIKALEKECDSLEGQIASYGMGGKARKAVGIVLRDW